MSKTPTLATNLEELSAVMDKFSTEESWQRALAFEPRPSDIIISPYAKCGTTWLQHIVHGLRTGGNMDFEEITVVTPWLEVAHDMGWDVNAPQVAEPRVFKSHLSFDAVPKGGRYICSFRHPADAFVSLYRFFEGFFFEPGTISLESFFHWRYPREKLAEQGYWYHLASWWEQRHNEDVLLLCYEDTKADLPGTVRRLTHFLGIEPGTKLVDTVVHQSSRDFMLAHRHQFDERPLRRRLEERGVIPFNVEASKVTPGASGAARYTLSPELREELETIWQEHLTPKFGFEHYEELRQALRELQREKG